MREIEITYTDVSAEEVILELAEYVKNGYRIMSYQVQHGYGTASKQVVLLVKR
jgi:hypothetical protein